MYLQFRPGRVGYMLATSLVFASCTAAQSKIEKPVNVSVAGGVPSVEFIQRVNTDNQPKQICFHPSRNEIYVTNLGGGGNQTEGPGSLQIFDSESFKVVHREPAVAAVECMIDPNNNNILYYSDMFSDSVMKFDLENRDVVFRAAVKESNITNFQGYQYRYMPKVMEIDQQANRLFVSKWLAGVSVIDLSSGNLIKRFPKFCSHPRGLLYDNNKLHVMCYGVPHGPGQIVILEANSGNVLSRVSTGGSPRHIVRIKNNKALISNLNSGLIYLYDIPSGQIENNLRVGAANTIVVDAGGEHVYVNDRSRNLIHVVDINAWQIIDTIKTGKFPTGLDVSKDGKYLAVTNFDSASFDLFKINRK